MSDENEQPLAPSEAATDPDDPDSAPAYRSPWAIRLSKLHWRAHCLAPNLIPHPAGDLRIDTAREQTDNETSRVELDAELRAPMIWGVELYGPAEIGDLYAGLGRLGWTRAGGWKPEHDAAHQVRAMRSNGMGAWMNIGNVRRRGDSSFGVDRNFAPLPDGVESLIVGASQVSASLTALVIGFQLSDSFSQRYESEINKDRRTRRQRAHRAWSIEWAEPVHQKKRAVGAVRSELRAMAGAWFARQFPGYFCSLDLRERFPTMELLVARGLIASDEDTASVNDWRDLLVDASLYDRWESSDSPGLQLSFERAFDNDSGLHIYATLDPTVFSDDTLGAYGGRGLRAYSWYCDRKLSGFLVHCAGIEFLKIHAQELHAARERLKIARDKSRNVSKTLDEIGGFFDKTLGSPAIVRELSTLSEFPVLFLRSCGNFSAKGWAEDDDPRMLYSEVQSGVQGRAARLTEDEESLRTHFEQLTTVLSVRESIRLQRRTLLLTFIALAVALGSLLIALYGRTGVARCQEPLGGENGQVERGGTGSGPDMRRRDAALRLVFPELGAVAATRGWGAGG